MWLFVCACVRVCECVCLPSSITATLKCILIQSFGSHPTDVFLGLPLFLK